MDEAPMTIMSPKAAILQKLVVVTSHMYIPAFGSSNLPSSVVLVHQASKLCSYLIIVTGTMGGARVKIFCQV